MKRVLDFVCAAAGLVLLSPLFVVIVLTITLYDGGSPFYRGWRVGLAGRPFRMLKFRTMRQDAEQTGVTSTASDDPRLTHIGSLLRRYKLDELPQLWNVVRGEMSLVGPRPQVQWAVESYSTEERLLLNIRPGITDYASLVFRDEGTLLRGSADPDRVYLSKIHPTKIRLGLKYISQACIWSDIRIICATLGTLVGLDPKWCLPEDTRSWLRNEATPYSN